MKDLTLHLMTDEDVNRQETLDAQNEYDCDRCTCKNPEGFTLEIDCGSVYVTHTQCGKQPWFMHDDFGEPPVYMEAVPVRVTEDTGCRGWPCDSDVQRGCDCGTEITLEPDTEGTHDDR